MSNIINHFFFQIIMQRLKSFVNAKRYFTETFSPERQQVIKDFKRQKDEIKREETILYKGSIVCLNVGLFGGVLIVGGIVSTPFVAGVPMALKGAGVTLLLSSSVTVFVLQVIQNHKIKNIFVNFTRTYKEHEKYCTEMKQYLVPLVKDVGLLPELGAFLQQNNSEQIMKFSILAEFKKAGLQVGGWKIDHVIEQYQSEFNDLRKYFN